MNIYMQRNKGKDDTIEPAYLSNTTIIAGSQQVIDALIVAVKDLSNIVKGTAEAEYQDGLVEKVSNLETAVNELVIHGVAKAVYKTTAEFNASEDVSEQGTIYVYSDGATYEGHDIPKIKIGNGVNKIKDLYFTDADIEHALENIIPVTQAEKDFWNNKVSCFIAGENIVFTTD